MLARAAAAVKAAGVKVDWGHADAARFTLPKKNDGAICLCEDYALARVLAETGAINTRSAARPRPMCVTCPSPPHRSASV